MAMMDGETYPWFSGPGSLSGALLFRGSKENPDRDNLSIEKDESEKEQQKGLLCRVCHLLITTSKESFEKDGRHLHTFFNPAGIVYEIGCFRRAPGCLTFGSPSNEFSWFGGYSWQIVHCRSCQQHLGWMFIGENRFFGLVVNKLTEG